MKKLRTIEMERLSVEEFKEAKKMPLIVVLDDVRSMHNVGSVFRTGDAFRIEAVYLCGITSTPPMAEIHKTALGAEDSVSWKYFDTALEAVEALKADGFEVYSVEQAHGSTMLQDFKIFPTNTILSPKCRFMNLCHWRCAGDTTQIDRLDKKRIASTEHTTHIMH